MNLNTISLFIGLTLGSILIGCKTQKPSSENLNVTQREIVLPQPPPIKPGPKNIILMLAIRGALNKPNIIAIIISR